MFGRGASGSRSWSWLLVMVVISIIILGVAMPVYSSPGGVGDRNLQANDCSFHSAQSSATISMSASNTNPAPGEQITVSVSVTGGSTGNQMGVALLSKTSGSSGTRPQDNNWTIVSDPSGSKFNYVEKSYSGSLTDTWTMKAPSSPGTYTLFAKIFHGNKAYVKLLSTGLTISVSQPQPKAPIITITSPANGATLSGTTSVAATVTPDTGQMITAAELRLDGALIGTVTTAPYEWTVATLSYANGPHTLNVTATDGGSRKGYDQISVVFSNVPQPPQVVITTPAAQSTVSGYTQVTVDATPLAGSSIVSVTLRIDGTSQGALSSPSYAWSLNTYLLNDGAHTLNVTATDSNGLNGYAQISMVVDNSLPSVRFISPTDGSVIAGGTTITANATSSTGPPSVELRIDGVTQTAIGSPPYAWNWDTTLVADGNHRLELIATDGNGNVSSAFINVTVLNGPPEVTILGPVQGATLNGTVNVELRTVSGRPLNWTRLFLGGELLAELPPGTSNYTFNSIRFNNGIYLLTAIGQDSLGRNGSAEVSVAISNDLASIRLEVAPGTLSGTVEVLVTATGEEKVVSVTLMIDGQNVSTLTAAPYLWMLDTTAYANGAHYLNATAVTEVGRTPNDSVRVEVDNQASSGESFDLTGVDLMVAQVLVIVVAIGIVYRLGKGPKVKK